MNYSLTYGRNVQMIWAMVLPAFIAIVPLVIAVELASKYYPDTDWLSILFTLMYLLVVMISTFVLIRSIQKEVIVTIANEAIHIQFQKKNFFHPSDIHLPISQIGNTFIQNDKGYDFLYIETNQSQIKNFYLRATESEPELLRIYEAINLHSEKSDPGNVLTPKLLHVNFYRKRPMKVFGWILLILFIIIPVYMYLKHLNPFVSSKFWILIITGTPIIYKVFLQKRETN